MFLPSYKAMLDLGKQKMATPDERRARLLRAIEAGEEAVMGNGEGQRRMEDETEVGRGGGWWDHLLGNFFGGDEDAMFTDLRMNKRVFRLVVSAVDDIALARRGRRAFVFSHEERIIFLHVHLAFGIDVVATRHTGVVLRLSGEPWAKNCFWMTRRSHWGRFWAQLSTIDSFAFLFHLFKLNDICWQKMWRLLMPCHLWKGQLKASLC